VATSSVLTALISLSGDLSCDKLFKITVSMKNYKGTVSHCISILLLTEMLH
jgi:hypothetical protein